MRIDSKREFYRLWRLNVLGNRNNVWDDYHVALAESTSEWFGLREVGKAGGGAWVKVHRSNLPSYITVWQCAGRKFVVDDATPLRYTLQGEVCRTYRGLEGLLGVSSLPMRPAMAAGHIKPRTGAAVLVLLDRYMDPSSRDDLSALLDLYPDATVEFSCFSIDVGIIPGRNTLFWEVRNY